MLRSLGIVFIVFIISFLSLAGASDLKPAGCKTSAKASISCNTQPYASSGEDAKSHHTCHFGHIGHCLYFMPKIYSVNVEIFSSYGSSRSAVFNSLTLDVLIKPPII